MDNREHDKITAFDTLFTNNHIQILKIVMPFFDHPMQKTLAVYIKFLEFQYAISWFRSHPFELYGCSMEKEAFDAGKICSEILPYCTAAEKQKVEQIAGLMHSMEMYKEMSQTFEMMKDFFPEGFGGADQDTGNSHDTNRDADHGMMDMLMNMLSPEQKAMFEMFGGNSSNESE